MEKREKKRSCKVEMKDFSSSIAVSVTGELMLCSLREREREKKKETRVVGVFKQCIHNSSIIM